MSGREQLEKEVTEIIKRNRWLTLSTASEDRPQSSVVVYASDGQEIIVLTGRDTVKAKNIKYNNRVSVTVPFYKNLIHRLITVAPPASISFSTTAEVLPFDHDDILNRYEKRLNFKVPDSIKEESVWIKMPVGSRVTCYGVGVSLLEMRNSSKAHKTLRFR